LNRLRYFVVTGIVLVVDFVTKRIVLDNQDTFREGIILIDGYLQFTYVRNAGAAFGMFQGGRWPFVVVSSLATIGLTWALLRGRSVGLRAYAYALILAGAAGNLVDRLFYDGLVVDFILMSWQEKGFPVYNVADMGVSIGAALLILTMLRERDPEDDPEEAADDDATPRPAGPPDES